MSSAEFMTFDMVEALIIISEVTPQQLLTAHPHPFVLPGESPPHRTHAQIVEDMHASEYALLRTYRNGEIISPSMVARDALHRSLWAMDTLRASMAIEQQENVQEIVPPVRLDTIARCVAPGLLYLSTLYPNQPAEFTDRFRLEHVQRSEDEQLIFLSTHAEAIRFVLGNSFRPTSEIVLRFVESIPRAVVV